MKRETHQHDDDLETWGTLAAPTARALIRLGFYEQEVRNRASKAYDADACSDCTADYNKKALEKTAVEVGIIDIDEPARISVKRI